MKEDLLGINEAAIFLGYSKKYLYKLVCQRKVPCYKPSGGKVFFLESDLLKWVTENRIKPENELEVGASTYIAKKALKK